MANMLARLGVVLGLDSAEFSKGIAAAEKDLAKFAAQAATYGKVAATVFATTTVAALKFADEIADTAKANDIAVDSILKLQHALQQSGGEAANAGRLLNSFNSFVDKAATGNFEAQQSFKQMGVSLKDIGNLSIDDLFNKVAESLAKIDDPITRNAKAVEVFGRAIKGVDLVGFNQQLEHGTGLTAEQTQSIIDAGDAWDLLAKRMHDAMVAFTAFVGTPALKMLEYLDSLPNYIDTVKTAFQNLGNTVAFVNNLTAAFIMRDVALLKRTVEDYQKIKQQIADGNTAPTGDEKPDGKNPPKDTGPKRTVKVAVDKEADAIQKVINKLKEKQAAEQLAYETKQQMFEIDRAGQYMLKEDVTLAKEIFEIKAKQKVMVDEINRAEKISPKQKAELVQAEKDIADAAERQARARAEIAKADRAKSFGTGFSNEMARFFRDAPTEMENGARAFQSVVGNMDAALSNFVRTGKLNFKDLTRSIIQDLIAIQMRMAIIGLFRMAFAGGSGGATVGAPVDSSIIATPTLAANGADAQAGQPFYVGERGPELFVPNGNGTIIPNGSFAGAMGGGGPTINYNGPYIASMSAIDTQSANQFLAKNKMAVWSANQSATRSVPVSR